MEAYLQATATGTEAVQARLTQGLVWLHGASDSCEWQLFDVEAVDRARLLQWNGKPIGPEQVALVCGRDAEVRPSGDEKPAAARDLAAAIAALAGAAATPATPSMTATVDAAANAALALALADAATQQAAALALANAIATITAGAVDPTNSGKPAAVDAVTAAALALATADATSKTTAALALANATAALAALASDATSQPTAVTAVATAAFALATANGETTQVLRDPRKLPAEAAVPHRGEKTDERTLQQRLGSLVKPAAQRLDAASYTAEKLRALADARNEAGKRGWRQREWTLADAPLTAAVYVEATRLQAAGEGGTTKPTAERYAAARWVEAQTPRRWATLRGEVGDGDGMAEPIANAAAYQGCVDALTGLEEGSWRKEAITPQRTEPEYEEGESAGRANAFGADAEQALCLCGERCASQLERRLHWEAAEIDGRCHAACHLTVANGWAVLGYSLMPSATRCYGRSDYG